MGSQEKTSSAKASSRKKTRSGKSSKRIKNSVKIDASIYILSWQDKAMERFSKDLANIYINPLSEHCLKRKNREKKEEKTEQNELKEKLNNALKALTEWDPDDNDDERLYEQSKVTLGELAIVSRLRTLHRLLKQLAEYNDKLRLWMLKHVESLSVSSEDGGQLLLMYCKHSFEAVAAIAEVFRFEQMDRMKCKKEYQDHVRGQGADEGNWKVVDTLEIDVDDPRKYVKPLEGKVNHLRHIVYILGTAMQNQLQCIFHAIPVTEMDVKPSEVKGILASLPPPFIYATEMTLSKFATKLLSNPPKGRWGGVTVTQSTEDSSKKTRGGSSSTRKKTSRYNNPLKDRKKDSKRSAKSVKSAKSSTKTPKRSNRSGRSKK